VRSLPRSHSSRDIFLFAFSFRKTFCEDSLPGQPQYPRISPSKWPSSSSPPCGFDSFLMDHRLDPLPMETSACGGASPLPPVPSNSHIVTCLITRYPKMVPVRFPSACRLVSFLASSLCVKFLSSNPPFVARDDYSPALSKDLPRASSDFPTTFHT